MHSSVVRTAVTAASCFALAFGCTPPTTAISGTQALLDAHADLTSQDHFFDFPYPSDLRLDAQGRPDLRGFPNPFGNTTVANLVTEAGQRPGFPVLPVAYFRFSAALAERDVTVILPAEKSSALLLIDVDPSTADEGTLFPVMATVLKKDSYTPTNVLAVSAPTGVILRASRKYAFVVLRSLKDATGAPLGSPLGFEQLKAGKTPDGSQGSAVAKLYAPLWPALEKAGVSKADVAAATVFTTADVVKNIEEISSKLRALHTVQITGLHALPSADNVSFCDLLGEVTLPQFQDGKPPFDTGGHFVLGADGVPLKQGEMTVPVHVSLPNMVMPATGYPLMLYVHGSGGTSSELIDRGYSAVKGMPAKGGGPASIVAAFGIAAASDAMPINPERSPGATDYAYLNFLNPGAFPTTFRQGIIEQRLFLDALEKLQITTDQVSGCTGPTLPTGATAFKFDPSHLVGMGHSMGAMYMNMISAVEPRIQAVVLSGAGGYWMNFIFQTGLIPGAQTLLGELFGSDSLSVLHPVIHIGETAFENGEPIVYTPRVGRRPLAGFPARPVYEPVGTADAYFPEPVLDDVALACGNQQAGAVVWPSLQTKLAIEKLDGIASYPVSQNRKSADGTSYTGVVAQYANDGILSGHNIAFQLPAVKHQYGCFLSTFLKTGVATVVAPGAISEFRVSRRRPVTGHGCGAPHLPGSHGIQVGR